MTNIIERLAPGPADPKQQWAQTTLQRIKASKVPRRRRRRFIVTGVIAGAVLGGGVAVAQTALAPDEVTHSIGSLQKETGLRPTTAPVKIADIHLSDGTRWQVWRGYNDHDGSCWTVGDPDKGDIDPHDIFGSTAPSCTWMPDEDQARKMGLPSSTKRMDLHEQESDFVRLDFCGQDERKGLPVVFGQVVQPAVKAVRVVGPGYVKNLRIDPETGGFGAELPYRLAHLKPGYLFDGVHVEFLDEDGHVVHTAFEGG
ncbi:hypothetical protein [Aeromicrobium ginsengisoli]|uniref:Uncharacterized protein n=1 Tax=Aeromicrobium ginsengisoli TaxID=363867 RepID=A0A5M4FCF1_9ACTN|nr:hypothetical protein [Aeromicrobium ginsengisoli]KAA1395937.1 hypothetical protein ESP70_017570 [Aeromicrobium ginsengisoli]